MQGKIIADQIILDAKSQANLIAKKAQKEIDGMREDYLAFVTKENEDINRRLDERENEILEGQKVSIRIEKNKILFRKKQEILFDIKQQAKEEILKFNKKKKLKLVDTLVKYNAEKGETLYINYPGLALTDVKALSVVKKLKLKVVKGSDLGIVISSETIDKNLLFDALIDDAVEKREKDISQLLFD